MKTILKKSFLNYKKTMATKELFIQVSLSEWGIYGTGMS